MYFIELLMIHSLIENDEEITEREYREIKKNLTNCAHKGRDKNFNIIKKGEKKPIFEVLEEKLKELKKIADMMFAITKDKKYNECVAEQEIKIKDNSKLPSNIVIDTMVKKQSKFL
jgi:gamma-glutamylcysteine synthetase